MMKKRYFNIFCIYEIFIQFYNNISIKVFRNNLNAFFHALFNNNNLNQNLIKDTIKQYNEIKKMKI